MNEADRETAARHGAIRAGFLRNPVVSPWRGRLPAPSEVVATLGFVIPVEDPAVCDGLEGALCGLERCRRISPFPRDYWHITVVPPAMLVEGTDVPAGMLPLSFAEEALEAARRAVKGAGPFEVTVRGLNAFRDVLVAVPYDGGRGRELGLLVRAAAPELPERYPDGHEPLPHVSLAQYTGDDALDGLAAAVREQSDTDFGRFRVERLDMYLLRWRDGRLARVEKRGVPL